MLTEGAWTVAIGRFDPMTAFEAQRLAELGKTRRLLVVVLDEDGFFLTTSARAALVAGLRDVYAVTMGRPAIPEQADAQIVEDFQGEIERRNAFVELVRNRQRIT